MLPPPIFGDSIHNNFFSVDYIYTLRFLRIHLAARKVVNIFIILYRLFPFYSIDTINNLFGELKGIFLTPQRESIILP